MNYIKRLQEETESFSSQINHADYAINDFRIFLQSSKFTGTDLDGSRKDYISTSDVMAQLQIIRNSLLGITT